MNYLIVLVFIQAPRAHASCQPTAQSLIDQCRAVGQGAAANAGAISSGIGAANTANTVAPGAGALLSAANQTATQGVGAVNGCAAIYQKCADITCTPTSETAAEKQKCATGIQGLSNQIATETGQARQTATGAANTQTSALGAGLMGAALGGLAGYMIGQSTADSGTAAATATTTAATTSATATLDCTSANAEAYRYSDCDSTFVTSCYGQATGGTCASFTARYCASTVAAGSSVALSTTLYETVDATGAGLATNYCRYASAQTYCATAGRGSCPSCLGLTSYASCAATSTVSCLSSSTSASATTINAQTICPTDPVFSDPSYSATVAAVLTGSGTTAAATPTAATDTPVASLSPASVSATDVSNQYGPSLFTITSAVLGNRAATWAPVQVSRAPVR